jgi:hypothetical protein
MPDESARYDDNTGDGDSQDEVISEKNGLEAEAEAGTGPA